jgi:archaellum component FlaC
MKTDTSNEDNELVTKGFLKSYLREALEDLADRLIKYIDYKVKPFEEMSQDYKDFKNQTFKNLDWLATQYEKFGDKYDYVTSKFIDLEDRYNNHERRISSMELNEIRKKKQN